MWSEQQGFTVLKIGERCAAQYRGDKNEVYVYNAFDEHCVLENESVTCEIP